MIESQPLMDAMGDAPMLNYLYIELDIKDYITTKVQNDIDPLARMLRDAPNIVDFTLACRWHGNHPVRFGYEYKASIARIWNDRGDPPRLNCNEPK